MARPSQYDHSRFPDDPSLGREPLKAALKVMRPDDRAHVLAWLCCYYQDDGAMFSPQLSRRRQRIVLEGVEYWLVRVPKR
jgi:hypothetical protein